MSHPFLWLAGYLTLNTVSRELRVCSARLRELEENADELVDQAVPLETTGEFEAYTQLCLILCYIGTIVFLTMECGSLIVAVLLTSFLSPLLLPFLIIPAAAGALFLMSISRIVGRFAIHRLNSRNSGN